MEQYVIMGGGVLGRNAARELTRLGRRVRIVNRSGKVPGLPPAVEIHRADLTDPAAARAAVAGATVVLQCAQPEYHRWAQEFPQLQRAILEASADAGARVVVADNLYGYGDPHGRPLAEDAPYAPHTRKGRVRAAMAQEAMRFHAQGRLQVAIARASDFFGPEDAATSAMMFPAALAGRTIDLIGRADQPHTFSYAPDFGRALALLATRPESWGEVWHIPSAPPVTQAEFVRLIGAALGTPLRFRTGGRALLTAMGLFNRTIAELPEMLYEWERPFVMDDSKFRRVFGTPHTPLDVAIGETVAWFRAQPGRS